MPWGVQLHIHHLSLSFILSLSIFSIFMPFQLSFLVFCGLYFLSILSMLLLWFYHITIFFVIHLQPSFHRFFAQLLN